jgi:hypothetical protein
VLVEAGPGLELPASFLAPSDEGGLVVVAVELESLDSLDGAPFSDDDFTDSFGRLSFL